MVAKTVALKADLMVASLVESLVVLLVEVTDN